MPHSPDQIEPYIGAYIMVIENCGKFECWEKLEVTAVNSTAEPQCLNVRRNTGERGIIARYAVEVIEK